MKEYLYMYTVMVNDLDGKLLDGHIIRSEQLNFRELLLEIHKNIVALTNNFNLNVNGLVLLKLDIREQIINKSE